MNETYTQTFTGEPIYEIYVHFNSIDQLQFAFDQTSNPDLRWELLSSNDDLGNLVAVPDFAFVDALDSDQDGSRPDEFLGGNAGKSADGTVRIFSVSGSPITQLVWRFAEDPVRNNINERFQFATEVCVLPDRSDAPTSGTAPDGSSPIAYGEATHFLASDLNLGATRDGDLNPIANATATGDDVDDDGVELGGTNLQGESLIAGSSLTLDINTQGTGVLNAWIDWNGDGDFADTGEQIALDATENGTGDSDTGAAGIQLNVAVPSGARVGNTFARFRFSTNAGLSPAGVADNGEVEDYQIAIASASTPELILVKRITGINTTDLTGFDNNDGRAEDDDPNWPTPLSTYLRGAVSSGIVKPGDEVEFTIYFLSSGDSAIANVSICDLVPDNMTFVADAFNGLTPLDTPLSQSGTDVGIALANSTTLPTAPTVYLTNFAEGDRGEFILPNTGAPGTCNAADTSTALPAGSNLRGAVLVDVVTGTATLPPTTGVGTPANAYGFIRFRATVN
ncbi:MAG: GEVED domain-containing protein [Cyanobacteria bacterium J06639_1]